MIVFHSSGAAVCLQIFALKLEFIFHRRQNTHPDTRLDQLATFSSSVPVPTRGVTAERSNIPQQQCVENTHTHTHLICVHDTVLFMPLM